MYPSSILYFGLGSVHMCALLDTQEVWCSDNRNSALTLAKLDQKFNTYDCDSSIIQTHYKMGQDVGLRGTPAIVLEDGSLISGYLSASDLSKILLTEIR